ncbi:MAG TPA: GDSL-type esterase/lipase family protein [Aliidongia sp.]|uniref:GDSL-type esterase/lipase family protein n=1 Tax=Aliidongia sp. TaxID=1914230 RepID=UPI002DDDAA58|nr:GDSL-type esterase/lipase family protein [Aliidongia sp.]HEV2675690.1 GDSL-type esterase/lipase family protein [Aliidongia sp.]
MAHWVTSWAGSVQGPYPIGNPSAQPDLRFALPNPELGARDQTFRLMVRPSLWGPRARLRLSNALGVRPVTFDGVHVGLQRSGSVVEPGSNRPVTFEGGRSVTVPPRHWIWSDPVDLPFVAGAGDPALLGRRLAVSLHVAGESGPMTWHAKGLTTSYLTAPGAGARGASDGVLEFPFTTTSWFFLDAVDMAAPAETRLIVCFGDSITDGTGSTLNGDDRWPDVLLRRLQARGIRHVAVANAGIGGNQVIGPADYAQPFPGGPSALDRMDRDVIGLSGVTTVIWLEGINDFGGNGKASAEAVIEGMTRGIARLRAHIPGVRVIGATAVTALGSISPAHGDAGQDAKRRRLNGFIRESDLFDGVADFDRAILDPATGGMRAEFVPDSTIGGPGDWLHPNRAGYQAMAAAIDLEALLE